jgi:hypothetical protein
MIYLDSCALMKLAHDEAESSALRAWLLALPSGETWVSSTLAEVETARALRRCDPEALPRLGAFLRQLDLFEIDQAIRRRAAAYAEPHLRPLDAIHLATAEELRAELTAFVTYDKRLLAAAAGAGFPAVAPV